jgi:hypothetical protein
VTSRERGAGSNRTRAIWHLFPRAEDGKALFEMRKSTPVGRRLAWATACALVLLVACKSNTIDAPTTNISAKCTGSFQHCTTVESDQCETNTDLDVHHCGACVNACSTVHGKPACNGGMCSIACNEGFADCNKDPSDGCETNLTTDPLHCGSCETLCSQNHAASVCNGARCRIVSCAAGFNDCNKDPLDGCESDPQTDPNHCATCDGKCTASNGIANCIAAQCSISCGTLVVCGKACVDIEGDANNCGGCGQACTGKCTGGRCLVTLASVAGGSAHGLAVDGAYVYWTNNLAVATSNGGSVLKVPIAGGPFVTLASAQPFPTGIAVDGTNVYWATGTDVRKIPLGGGSPLNFGAAPGSADGLAVDATSAYWGGGKVALAGGAPVAFQTQSGAPGIAVDATSVYSASGSTVIKVPLGGGAPVTLATGQVNAFGIAVDATSVYWTNNSAQSGSIMKVAIGGGNPTTLTSVPAQSSPQGIAVDDTSVYWTNQGNNVGGKNGSIGANGTVMKMPLAGGVPVTLATGQCGPNRIVVAGTSLYWANAGYGVVNGSPTGDVMKLTPR